MAQTVQTNKVFGHLVNSSKRITVEQGGTRSGKTYNILLWIIFDYSIRHKDKIISICRKTYPALRTSAMRDFFDILKIHNLYVEDAHNKTQGEYRLNGNLIEFMSLDQPQKVRGRKRSLLFVNEANELFYEDWQQLVFRTEDKLILDYNPSDEFHWIYDKVIPRDDAEFFKTTYNDNPFLSDSIKDEIQRLRETDEDYWRIYGLGERGRSRATIFQFGEAPITSDLEVLSYGLDFGYVNDPSVLVAIYINREKMTLVFDEIFYQTGCTNQDLFKLIKESNPSKYKYIYADSAEPKSIDFLRARGLHMKNSDKGRDSILAGIDVLKQYKLFVTPNSQNLIKEFRNYKWKEDKNGKTTNSPIDLWNHGIDSIRYGTFSELHRPNFGRYSVR